MISFQKESLASIRIKDCWPCMTLPRPPLSSMHNLRYKTTLENKVRALFTETWSPHVVLSLTFWLNYSASFLHWIFLLRYPYSITLYILNKRLIKQLFLTLADTVPTSNSLEGKPSFRGGVGLVHAGMLSSGPGHLLLDCQERTTPSHPAVTTTNVPWGSESFLAGKLQVRENTACILTLRSVFLESSTTGMLTHC